VASSGVSVVIPAYNAERFLSATVASVFAQTVPPDEVIVVDDGSTDGTPALLERLGETYPLRTMRRDNGGQARARNDGVAAARGEFVALLDHDDQGHPSKLERQLDQLAADPSLGMCFTAVNIIRDGTQEADRLQSWNPEPAAALQKLLTGCHVKTPSTVIARREVLARVTFDDGIRPTGLTGSHGWRWRRSACASAICRTRSSTTSNTRPTWATPRPTPRWAVASWTGSSMTIPKFPEGDIGARIGACSQQRMETGAGTC
jgi:glycosyltransferase involved in cell wall biosynthesis